jgi:hypothetical protein
VRTEFGVPRTVCACKECKRNCQFMPGFLIPADLERLAPNMNWVDLFDWAERNLLASPGALVMKDGELFRIPTLVPAVKADGSCIHLTNGQCGIHENAPFGCAFFDCGPDRRDGIVVASLTAVHKAFLDETSLYRLVWFHLFTKGLRQSAPEVLRKRMAQ